MELATLQDLYVHELKDLYSAEKQLVSALPKMAEAANNGQVAAGFREHLKQTKGHVERLEKILSAHKRSTRGARCKGMEGIIAEGAEMIEEEAVPEVKRSPDLGRATGRNTTGLPAWGRCAPRWIPSSRRRRKAAADDAAETIELTALAESFLDVTAAGDRRELRATWIRSSRHVPLTFGYRGNVTMRGAVRFGKICGNSTEPSVHLYPDRPGQGWLIPKGCESQSRDETSPSRPGR